MLFPGLYVKPLGGEPFRFLLDKDVVVVGSSLGTDLLVVADECVAGRHMEIRRDHGRHYLHDLGSRSGTYLNGVRISGPVPLQDGDLITVGDLQMRFVRDAARTIELEPEGSSRLDEVRGCSASPGDLRGIEKGLGSILGQDRQSTLPALTVRPRRTDRGPEPLSLPGRLRRWVAALRALVGRLERPVGRFVDCSLFAPPRITPGRSILVQAFLYLDEDQELMQRLATTLIRKPIREDFADSLLR